MMTCNTTRPITRNHGMGTLNHIIVILEVVDTSTVILVLNQEGIVDTNRLPIMSEQDIDDLQ